MSILYDPSNPVSGSSSRAKLIENVSGRDAVIIKAAEKQRNGQAIQKNTTGQSDVSVKVANDIWTITAPGGLKYEINTKNAEGDVAQYINNFLVNAQAPDNIIQGAAEQVPVIKSSGRAITVESEAAGSSKGVAEQEPKVGDKKFTAITEESLAAGSGKTYTYEPVNDSDAGTDNSSDTTGTDNNVKVTVDNSTAWTFTTPNGTVYTVPMAGLAWSDPAKMHEYITEYLASIGAPANVILAAVERTPDVLQNAQLRTDDIDELKNTLAGMDKSTATAKALAAFIDAKGFSSLSPEEQFKKAIEYGLIPADSVYVPPDSGYNVGQNAPPGMPDDVAVSLGLLPSNEQIEYNAPNFDWAYMPKNEADKYFAELKEIVGYDVSSDNLKQAMREANEIVTRQNLQASSKSISDAVLENIAKQKLSGQLRMADLLGMKPSDIYNKDGSLNSARIATILGGQPSDYKTIDDVLRKSADQDSGLARDIIKEIFTFGQAQTKTFNRDDLSKEYDKAAWQAGIKGMEMAESKEEFITRIIKQQNTGEVLKDFTIYMIPIVGTLYSIGKGDSGGQIALSAAIDVATFIPFIGQAAAIARAGARPAAALGKAILAEVKAPLTSVLHPLATAKVALSPFETMIMPRKIPLSSAELSFHTVRLPVVDVGGKKALAMALRDEITKKAIAGKTAKATKEGVTAEIQTTALNKTIAPAVISATPDVRPFLDGLTVGVVKDDVKGAASVGKGRDLFVSPSLHTKFSMSTAAGVSGSKGALKGAIIIRDPELLSKLKISGKTWAGTAEIEMRLPAGTVLPKPDQLLYSRDAYGDLLHILVINGKASPLTQTEINQMKIIGSADTLKNIFNPGTKAKVSKKAGKTTPYDELVEAQKNVTQIKKQLEQLKKTGRISPLSEGTYALGDLHGKYNQVMHTLTREGFVDEAGNWIAKDTTLVQAGDIVDRGYGGTKLINKMQVLDAQASKMGSRITTLMGNHDIVFGAVARELKTLPPELLSQAGKVRSKELLGKYAEYFRSTGNETSAKLMELFADGRGHVAEALSADSKTLEWLKDRPAMYVKDGVLYVHADSPNVYMQLLKEAKIKGFKGSNLEIVNKYTKELAKTTEGSKHFYDLMVKNRYQMTKESAMEMLKTFDAERLVHGHTPQGGRITSKYDGLVTNIDSGSGTNGVSKIHHIGEQNIKLVRNKARAITRAEMEAEYARAMEEFRMRDMAVRRGYTVPYTVGGFVGKAVAISARPQQSSRRIATSKEARATSELRRPIPNNRRIDTLPRRGGTGIRVTDNLSRYTNTSQRISTSATRVPSEGRVNPPETRVNPPVSNPPPRPPIGTYTPKEPDKKRQVTTEITRPKLKNGDVAWRQGALGSGGDQRPVWYIKRADGHVEIVFQPPEDAPRLEGTPEETFFTRGKKPPTNLTQEMGVTTAKIDIERNPEIRFVQAKAPKIKQSIPRHIRRSIGM
ncbi:metallophosphoesterase [Dehalococcoides mccartyi]|uniref:Ser/Thr protein phosphatase family protein n=1 Tax=Dehalococcoides mccartyi (strain ATCC BAA-2266 / KCTC 15142 / 195) TaxID=243164 RepID=Q3Z9Q8_DEHM1|nr:metallophosphoesterase [Dehalococcoides mccartyi]AAW39848.1 Ser/Thr protein phosphatase family protein [Dehalococcoides mccartyi 195]AAW40391.1 Ser/Thr protein phosphatase family protein [Dehalococcoides mccartyi 195]AAW40438.1 Ser/Thr protein phosphatase family protein [Dehalococcoides mccartyi 195]